MQPSPTVLALACASILALSGCSGDAPEADPLASSFDDLDLQATSTTGVLRGVVVDEAIRPVAGAKVTLGGSSAEALSDDSGLFGFEGLSAGNYFLTVEKRGYVRTQQSTAVVAGVADPPILKVLLVADPSTLAYVEVTSYEGYIQCGFKVAMVVFDAGSCDPQGATGLSKNDDSAPWFPVSRKPMYYQSEMTWEPAQEFSRSLVTIQVACDLDDCGETDTNRLCNVRGPAPLVCKVNMTAAADGGGGGHGLNETGLGGDVGGFTVQMFAGCYQQCVVGAVGLGIALEQRFQVFNHVFYGYEPPADWVFLTDGPPPPPPA